MTAPDELQRAVERLSEMTDWTARGNPGSEVSVMMASNVLRLLLSERAELLATVERMRGALGRLATATERLMAAWPDTHVPGRKLCVEVSEALNDAKARAKTTPNAGERG